MNANAKEKTARSAGSLLRSYTPILYLVIFVTVAGLFVPNFASKANFLNILKQSAVPIIACVSMTFILITGNIFLPIYQKFGYEKRLLSRSIEDSATVTSPLIPWNSCGITQATVLSVPTITYLPYCFFNYISPLISMLIAAIGYKIYRRGISKSRSLEY